MKTTRTTFRVAVFSAALAAALFVSLFAGGGGSRAAAQEAKAKMCGADVSTWAGRPGTLYKQSYALVIGGSEYKYKRWPTLQGAKSDVIAVKEVLEKHGFKIKTLFSPTRQEFEDALKEFKSKHDLSNPARFLFYFAGHGYTDEISNKHKLGYIVTSDAPPPEGEDLGNFRATAVSMQRMVAIAREISSCHALFVFDSCFSGIILTETRGPTPIPIMARMHPVRLFLTAGTENQPVLDDSVFRNTFVSALNGAADSDEDGYVTGSELGEYVVNRVSNATQGAQTPRYGKIQDAALAQGDFVFEVLPHRKEGTTHQKEGTTQTTILPLMLETEYYPSGWMGDVVELKGTGKITFDVLEEVIEGNKAIATRVEYKQGRGKGWAGVYWQHPENNWGDKPGLNLTGAKQISFYARGERGGEIVEFHSGGIGLSLEEKKRPPYYDRYKKSLGRVPLTNKWKKYVIDLSNVPASHLSSVVGAFAWGAVGGYDKEGRLVTYIAELKVE